ncbi:hypothetical protein SDC9_169569 [bioreactor metagenome]|uniref:Uncharacterized protein n=1 Tax=bioreactor metagenome TaxID=1076179 RepID=A0A645G7S1_9ZZZZ
MLGLKIDNPVGILDDCTCRRAGLQAARIFTVHAAVFTNQPFQFAVLFGFAKTHHRPGLGAEIGGVVVHPDTMSYLVTDIVPLRAGHLAGFAAHTGGDVNELGDLGFVITRLRWRRNRVCCGPFDDVLRFHRHMFASLTPSRC